MFSLLPSSSHNPRFPGPFSIPLLSRLQPFVTDQLSVSISLPLPLFPMFLHLFVLCFLSLSHHLPSDFTC